LREHQGSGRKGWTRWTRRFIRGASRGCKVRVQPGIHHRPNRRCRTGATWGSVDGRAERPRDRGNLEDWSIGSADGPEF